MPAQSGKSQRSKTGTSLVPDRESDLGRKKVFIVRYLAGGPSDRIKLTSCQRCGSGSLDQTGIPRRTTPLVSSQNRAPGLACCTSSERRLGPFLPPSAVAP